jgi:molybdopterin-synthase adenylyltransferase
VSLELEIPWIFTGCTGASGQVMPVIPGKTACLRCLMATPPPPGTTETCDTAGVLGPAIGVVASVQAALALKILTGHADSVNRQLLIVDVWNGSFRTIDLSTLRDSTDCPACRRGERLWLHGTQRAASTILCGRNSVQVTPAERPSLSLPELAEKLQASGKVVANGFLIRLTVPKPETDSEGAEPYEMTVFPDGRAIIRGTSDPAVARSLYARYIGS